MDRPRYFDYWGKARKEDGVGEPYHLLPYHSLDVAAVGQMLLDRHPLLLDRLAGLMHLPKPEAHNGCIFLLGIHDLGKFARSFQMLREDLQAKLWPDEQGGKQGYSVRHDCLGKIIWDDRRMGIRRRLFGDASESLGTWKRLKYKPCLFMAPSSSLRQGLHTTSMRPLARLEYEALSGANLVF